MTDTSQPKPADKVWAMYKGHFAPYGVERERWYPVRDFGDTFHFLPIFNEDGRQKWASIWQRHVGPTPPDASPVPDSEGVRKAQKTLNKQMANAAEIVASDDYRIIERAPKKEKRRKTLLVEYDGAYHPCATMADVDAFQEIHGGTLYTAKLTPVKDTDK